MKKIRSDDPLSHWASIRIDMVSPKVLVGKALNNKVNSVREKSSGRVTKRFHDVFSQSYKFKDTQGQSKKAIELTKGPINEWIGDPNILH